MTLTRQQFELACKAYSSKYSLSSTADIGKGNDQLKKSPTGWTWNEHSFVQGLGFLSRSASIPYQHFDSVVELDEMDELVEVIDDAAASTSVELVYCHQYVVYSATFKVPAFYFSLHRSNGALLPLEEILSSRLFLRSALPEGKQTSFALDVPGSNFAMLSQGDHPTLNTPCWYLHPCHTAQVVDEIMHEVAHGEMGRPLRWLEAWFMMLGNVVDLRLQ